MSELVWRELAPGWHEYLAMDRVFGPKLVGTVVVSQYGSVRGWYSGIWGGKSQTKIYTDFELAKKEIEEAVRNAGH